MAQLSPAYFILLCGMAWGPINIMQETYYSYYWTSYPSELNVCNAGTCLETRTSQADWSAIRIDLLTMY